MIRKTETITKSLYNSMFCHRTLFHGTTKDTARTFKVLGVQQIAIGALNKNDLNHFWGTLLGLKKVDIMS